MKKLTEDEEFAITMDLAVERVRMQDRKRAIKFEVRKEHEAAIQAEIDKRTAEAEREFAARFKAAHDAGVSQAVLRRDVLRTNAWNVWVKWRDLGLAS